MWTRLWKEVEALHLLEAPPPRELVSEVDLAGLPPVVRRYLSFYGVVAGAPRHWAMRMAVKGRFRRTPDERWMPVEAVQYNLARPVSRIFHMKARLKGIPLLARDTYVRGRGHMLGKLGGVIKVADGKGPEFDLGELVTWLDDAVLYAPSMLLGPQARWSPLEARSFEVAFSDEGREVKARVFLDGRGAPIDFETQDRYLNDPADPRRLVQGTWRTPVEWRDQRCPTRGKALWRLAGGDFVYAEYEVMPGSVVFDVLPAAGLRAA